MKSISIFSLLLLVLLGGACNDDDGAQSTPTTPPDIQFTNPANSGGCVDFQFYYYSDNREYGLLLSGNKDSLNLTSDWQSFSLDEDNPNNPTLKLYEFSQPATDYFCDDVVEAKNPIQEWDAEAGTIRLRIVREENDLGIYAMDVVMIEVLVNGVRLERIERTGVEVGWFPG